MRQFITETSITNGHLELNNIPLSDNLQVKVIVIPKTELAQMSFPEIWKSTQSFRGNLADDINVERDD